MFGTLDQLEQGLRCFVESFMVIDGDSSFVRLEGGLCPNHDHLLRCWKNSKRFSLRRSVYPKVSLVDSEDTIGVEFARKVNQTGIGFDACAHNAVE